MATDAHRGASAGRWRRFLQALSGALELPSEVLLDLPRTTLIGSMQVHIENHKGVLQFLPSCVRIAARNGELVISGSRLKIECIGKDEVQVAGRIDRIDLVGRAERSPERRESGRTS